MVPGRLAVALLCAGWPRRRRRRADRLERFRAVARERARGRRWTAAERDRAIGELYELVDAEVLDSLRGEEPFSSLVFIRDRLDAMMEAWGGATLRVLRIPAAGSRAPVTVGLYSPRPAWRARARSASTSGPGRRRARGGLHPRRPARRAGVAGGTATGWRACSRCGADRSPGRGCARCTRSCGKPRSRSGEAAWTTATQWPEGLAGDRLAHPGRRAASCATSRLPGLEARMRGADRAGGPLPAGRGRAGSRSRGGRSRTRWHRELGAAADRLFQALAAGGRGRRWARLVPAPALRARLPPRLVPEPVCEQRGPGGPRGDGDGGGDRAARRPARAVGAHMDARPGAAGWRLTAAGPCYNDALT